MSDRAVVRLARMAASAGALLAVGGAALFVALTGLKGIPWKDGAGLGILMAVSFGVLVWLVSPQQPRNPVVWTMVVSGFGAGLYIGAHALAALIVEDPDQILRTLVPAEVPLAADLLALLGVIGVYTALFVWVTFGLLLFPDGRPPTPRWRWVAWTAAVGVALMGLGAAWERRPWSETPALETGALIELGALVVMVAAVASLAALVVRLRRSSGEARDRFKWVVWGAGVLVPWFMLGFVVGNTEYENLALVPLHVAAVLMFAAYGIAVGKYRLFDIDVVISRTIVYGVLAVTLGLLYTASVFSLVLAFRDTEQGATGDLGVALPLGATLMVALAFEPLRQRLQRWANRLVYGDRAAPAEVLSQLTRHLDDASLAGNLAGLADLLRRGTAAEAATVWLRVGDRLRPVAVSPHDLPPPESKAQSVADLSHPEPSLAVGVTHAGDTLGALQIAKPRAHPVTQADRQLLDDVAAGAGLLLRNLKLNAELADRARALEASRRRLIAAQDTARHRLERDLHDGAQQQVVALKVKLGIARTLAERDGVEEIAARLASLADQTDRAITQMRRIARGIYPPLLEAEGLATALAAVERTFDRPVTVTAEGIGRYDKQIEETAYFGALTAINDALTNGATTVAVTVAEAGERLVVAVDSDATRPLGASGLVDRIEALGGAIDVVPTAPGRLTAAIPTNVEVASG